MHAINTHTRARSVAGETLVSRRHSGVPKERSSSSASASAGVKVSRRSRSKSPFRSFRWKRTASKADDGAASDDEGIG